MNHGVVRSYRPHSFFFPRCRREYVYLLALLLLTVLFLLPAGCAGRTVEQTGAASTPPSSGDENYESAALPEAEGEEGRSAGEEELNEIADEEALREEEERRLREERRLLEERLREELGVFYVPPPPLEQADNPPVKARGIYVTGHSVAHPRYELFLEMAEKTELNSFVIDVKDDHGRMTYKSAIEVVEQVGANRSVPVRDIEAVIEELNEKDIFPIARVVVFKDPILAEQKPEWSIQRNEGGIWRDRKNVPWVDPYNRNVWEYNVAIAKEAALMGFREIQFDYVRFPENAHLVDRQAYYPAQDHLSRDEVIREFLIYAAEQLEGYNVYLSADVFGVIATSWGDSDRIGQTWEDISPYVDYICPMVYPSHYGYGYFELDVPDAHPEKTVRYALIDSLKRNAPLKNPGIIRPWLQSFTAGWIRGNISYGPAEVRSQIDVALELGIDEYLLWNAKNRYDHAFEALLTAEEADQKALQLSRDREEAGRDALGRTAVEALEIYLEAIAGRDWREAYALQITDCALDHHSYPEWRRGWSSRVLGYRVSPPAGGLPGSLEAPVHLEVDVHMSAEGREFTLAGESWEVKLQNNLWRVRPSENFLELLARGDELPFEGGLSHRP